MSPTLKASPRNRVDHSRELVTTDPRDIAVLFTAFEPSGDEHAAIVIAELKRRHPELTIYGWGGERMAQAGAIVVEQTGQDAVMGLPGLAKIMEHKRINKRVRTWLTEHKEVVLHVPVDSPAANFPICEISKKLGRKIVHLVAPQVWAWGTWRISKLRRLSDLVLCLLPFEEPWFTERRVPARFIGHPQFDRTLDRERLDAMAAALPSGSPKLALLPGSRPGEHRKNFGMLLDAYRELRRRHPGAVGTVAATTPAVAERLRTLASAHGGWPEGLEMVHEKTDAVIHWSDLALVVSGTVTLQIARHAKPMVIVYRSNPLLYYALARWLLASEFLTLPNLIAGKEVVPELVPHFGGAELLIEKADELLTSPEAVDRQRAALTRIVDAFRAKRAGPEGATLIEGVLRLSSPAQTPVAS